MSIQEKIEHSKFLVEQRRRNQEKQVKSLRKKAERHLREAEKHYGNPHQIQYWLQSARHASSQADWLDYLLGNTNYKGKVK